MLLIVYLSESFLV